MAQFHPTFTFCLVPHLYLFCRHSADCSSLVPTGAQYSTPHHSVIDRNASTGTSTSAVTRLFCPAHQARVLGFGNLYVEITGWLPEAQVACDLARDRVWSGPDGHDCHRARLHLCPASIAHLDAKNGLDAGGNGNVIHRIIVKRVSLVFVRGAHISPDGLGFPFVEKTTRSCASWPRPCSGPRQSSRLASPSLGPQTAGRADRRPGLHVHIAV